jgi:drug/metabolite transporter (DMT)-like permease
MKVAFTCYLLWWLFWLRVAGFSGHRTSVIGYRTPVIGHRTPVIEPKSLLIATFGNMGRALLQLHMAVLLAGFTGVLGKLIGLNEGLLVGWRMLVTALSLGLLLLVGQGPSTGWRVAPKRLAALLGTGGIVALHWLFFYASIKYANVSVALTCFSATGFFTAFAEPLLNRRRINPTDVLLGLMAIVGIYIIFDFHPQYKTGIAFGMAAAVGCAIFPVINKKLIAQTAPRTLVFYEMWGGVLLLSLLLPFYLRAFPAAYYWPTAMDWLWLLVLCWACTIFSFDLQLRALRKITAFTANLSYNLEPVYGILLAFALFNEHTALNSGFYWGLALILGAVLLQMRRVGNDG